jgi:hypothetical protein
VTEIVHTGHEEAVLEVEHVHEYIMIADGDHVRTVRGQRTDLRAPATQIKQQSTTLLNFGDPDTLVKNQLYQSSQMDSFRLA